MKKDDSKKDELLSENNENLLDKTDEIDVKNNAKENNDFELNSGELKIDGEAKESINISSLESIPEANTEGMLDGADQPSGNDVDTNFEDFSRLHTDDIVDENEDLYNKLDIPNYNYVDVDPKKVKQKKAIIISSLIILLIVAALLFIFFSPKKGNEYNSQLIVEKIKASHFITYSKDNITDIELYNSEGILQDSLKPGNFVYKASDELEGLYFFDNDSDNLFWLYPEEDKLIKKEVLKYSIENTVSYIYKNSKYLALVTEKEITFININDSSKVASIDLSKIENFTTSSLEDNCYFVEDKFFFICNSIIYQYDILGNNLDNMDFYKNNNSLILMNENLYLFNEFGSSYDQKQLFIIDPYKFLISDNLLLNSKNIIVAKGKLNDSHFGLYEIKQGESKEGYKLYLTNNEDKVEFALPTNEGFTPYGALYCTSGYAYFIEKTASSNNFIKMLDIYSLEETTISTKNLNFVPIVK